MSQSSYEAVIGLEVHCQLLTDSKAFSPESAVHGAEPNTNVDPVSLGHPGTLPVINSNVIDLAIRMGLATGSRISPRSVFARKHYFYPDLPKGYQISQDEAPICTGGSVEIEVGESQRSIGLTRIHIEEDAGKSLHDQDPTATALDYNRGGVPLIEIVSEPDIRTPREAALFLQRIRQIVRYLDICDGNMEQGSLRCDANVSIRKKGETTLGTKAEIKNMNSFRHVERALQFEIDRQIGVVERGEEVVQETRLWDSVAEVTRSMRSKEEAHDYRYFPDPDLMPLVVDEERLETIRRELPELPEQRRRRFVSDLELPDYDAGVLTEDRPVADYFEDALDALVRTAPDVSEKEAAKAVSNVVMTLVLRALKESDAEISSLPVDPERLAGMIAMRLDDRISSSAAQELFDAMLTSDEDPVQLAEAMNLLQVSDDSALLPIVDAVIDEHPKQLEQYRNGKSSLIGFFIGQVMRRFDGSPDPKRVRELLQDKLEAGVS